MTCHPRNASPGPTLVQALLGKHLKTGSEWALREPGTHTWGTQVSSYHPLTLTRRKAGTVNSPTL